MMKSSIFPAKTRPLFAVFLSAMLILFLCTPILSYANEKKVSEVVSGEEVSFLLESEEPIVEDEIYSHVDSTQEGVVTSEEISLIDSGVMLPTASIVSESTSLAIAPTEAVSPFALGDTFTETISVDNGGVISSVSCEYKVTNDSPANRQVQIGSGTVTAIPAATAGALIIPTTITDSATDITYTVTSIGNNAFQNCSSLTGTGLGSNSTVTSLGIQAFESCSSLLDTGLGSNSTVTSIGAAAFQYCSSLINTGLATNTTITFIDNVTFDHCSSLTSTGIESNSAITYIDNLAFAECSSLIDTGLGSNSTITSMGESIFEDCTSLTVTGLESNTTLTVLPLGTFYGCSSLTDTGLGSNSTITLIDARAFQLCTSLIETGLDNNYSITSIGNVAFFGCTSLGTVETPTTNQGDLVINSQITIIGSDAFANTSYERIYLLVVDSSSIATGPYAFTFLGGQGTLYVPESWDTGVSPITFSDESDIYTYSDADGTLVVMYDPVVKITTTDVSRVPGTADEATVTFQVDVDPDVTIKDSAGTVLWTGSVSAGVPVTVTLSGLSSEALSGFTIEAAASITYPDGVTPRYYNERSGTGIGTFAVPAIAYSIVFIGNGADNSDAMAADTMFLSFGQTATLVANAYTWTTYVYQGWNTGADGSGTFYADEASVLNLTNVEDGVVTLYAQWSTDPVPTPSTTSADFSTGKVPKTNDILFPWVYFLTGAFIVASLSLVAFRRRGNKIR